VQAPDPAPGGSDSPGRPWLHTRDEGCRGRGGGGRGGMEDCGRHPFLEAVMGCRTPEGGDSDGGLEAGS